MLLRGSEPKQGLIDAEFSLGRQITGRREYNGSSDNASQSYTIQIKASVKVGNKIFSGIKVIHF